MSSLIADVCLINEIKPHNNADTLEIAVVKGWECVVPKGKYHVGDKVVYIPVDAILPTELSDKLNVTKYLSKGRVRAAKLRGIVSCGLIIDVENPDWPIEYNVVEHYGLTKWEPLVPQNLQQDKDHPLFHKYFDIENIKNFPDIIKTGELVYITEKIHGSNSRVGIIFDDEILDYRFIAGSHNSVQKEPEEGIHNRYWHPIREFEFAENIRNMLIDLSENHKSVILFGEIYGRGVQNLHYDCPNKLGFRAFDISLDGQYIDKYLFFSICDQYQIPIVPIIYCGPFYPEVFTEYCIGKSTFGDHIKEGAVVTPVKERLEKYNGGEKRVIFKFISDEYLLKKDITDSH